MLGFTKIDYPIGLVVRKNQLTNKQTKLTTFTRTWF